MKDLEKLVESARNGNREALSELLENIREKVFQLALRMLAYPSDAEDATQEILIKVMTNLAEFRQRSSFETWVYRIGINHLLNIRRKRADKVNFNFQAWEEYIYADRGDVRLHSKADQEKAMLINETRTLCMQGMLLCLEKNVRAAFILGEIFEFSSKEGAQILNISAPAFRKRLSRGREKLYTFMKKNCGLIDDTNPCKCQEQVERDLNLRLIDPQHLHFKHSKLRDDPPLDISTAISELDDMGKMVSLFRTYPNYSSPDSSADMVKKIIKTSDYGLFHK